MVKNHEASRNSLLDPVFALILSRDIREPAMAATEESYGFPYAQPYLIQLDLMRHLTTNLSKASLCVVESPTGTGKSLSLLCASLTWLRQHRQQVRQELVEELRVQLGSAADSEPDWVVNQQIERRVAELDALELQLEERLQVIRLREVVSRTNKRSVRRRPLLPATRCSF